MILILDDDPDRHRYFRRNLVGAHLVQVTTAPEAIRELQRLRPSVICLDFDLDQHGTPLRQSGTGWDVASYLLAHYRDFRRAQIVVHSINPLAGPAMADLLEHAGFQVAYRPQAWRNEALCRQLAALDRAA